MNEKYQYIDFVTLETVRTSYENKESFQLRLDRPHKWLQKFCLFILRKIGAFYVVDSITMNRRRIDANTFMERLFKQISGIERCFNMRPTHILIGAEDYAALMYETAANQMFSFDAKYGFDREILGLKVEVIPWMRGVLVMPPYGEKMK